MQIVQFEDKNLSHYSYAILSECEKKIVLIDPTRNAKQYLIYAKENNAEIAGIIETHPHADFVSSHLELHQSTGATIYTSKDVHALYPHRSFDEGQTLQLGNIKLTALNTPGHSPDSISILLEHAGKQNAIFTGDTLFIGDCGRPDLREDSGKIKSTRLELAKQMYNSLRGKFMKLPDDVIVYPAHGAGTLCGKNLSKESSSTIGKEKLTNWALKPMTVEEFTEILLDDQPFIPVYFPYDVELNRKGAESFKSSFDEVLIGSAIETKSDADTLDKDIFVVDARKEKEYKKGHLTNSINLMEGEKFSTWLGSIINPGEQFYLAGENTAQLQNLIEQAAAIGYETQIKEAFVLEYAAQSEMILDINIFKENIENYTIIDVRNDSEVKDGKLFKNSISIPLPEIRSRVNEISTAKPIVIHCAGGYRSAAASSIIKSLLNGKAQVYDLGEAIKEF